MTEAYEGLVLVMGDLSLSMEKRERASQLLRNGDREVLPVLIYHLKDLRIYQEDYRDVSEMSDPGRNVPSRSMTVAEKCRCLLYEIVYGTVRVPSEARVLDWDRWWEMNREKPLHEIIAHARTLRLQYGRR